jgi:hypothetical protein
MSSEHAGGGLYDLSHLVSEVGLTRAQARWLLAPADRTGHDGRPMIVGADAVELLRRRLPPELRDDGEDAS